MNLSENLNVRRQVKADLEVTLSLFSKPGSWTQHVTARKANGSSTCSARGSEATSFCLAAGIERSIYQSFLPDDYKACSVRYRQAYDYLEGLMEEETGRACVALTRWNDMPERTQTDVLELLKTGIHRLESTAGLTPQETPEQVPPEAPRRPPPRCTRRPQTTEALRRRR